jgi:thiol-disulfide isomerase/thioredoxin
MNKQNLYLVIALVFIVGGISLINAQKVERGSAVAQDILIDDRVRTTAENDVSTTDSDTANNPLIQGRSARVQQKEKTYERAKEITTPDGFVNTKPFALKDIIGDKVVLIDFWTYSCINCQRTFPYLRAWYAKYKDDGLVIVGIHTPEFAFERELSNVKSASAKFGLEYPIVLDNDYSTWGAYKNQYWPREYLIDADGFIVHDHIGEGGYAETEKAIVAALNERKRLRKEKELAYVPTAPVDAIAPSNGVSPETYFGFGRRDDTQIANKGAPTCDGSTCDFVAKDSLEKNQYALGGSWQTDQDSIESKSASTITFKAHTKMMYLVAQAKSGTLPVRVYVDGTLTKTLSVKDSTLYDIAAFSGVEDHLIELKADKPGLIVFTFTFG